MEDPNIGVDAVEKILDACHSIRFQVPRTPGIKRRSHKDLKKYYIRLLQNDKTGFLDGFNINKIPLESLDYAHLVKQQEAKFNHL